MGSGELTFFPGRHSDAGRSGHKAAFAKPLLTAAVLLVLTVPAPAGLLEPAWSAPVRSPVVSSAVIVGPDSTEVLWLLGADGRLASVSLNDTLRDEGPAPAGIRWLSGGGDSLFLFGRDRLMVRGYSGPGRSTPFQPGVEPDSVWWAGSADGVHRFVLWARGLPLMVTTAAPGAKPPPPIFAPRWATVDSSASEARLLGADEAGVFALRLDGIRMVRADWRERTAAGPEPVRSPQQLLALFDIDSDDESELVVLTNPVGRAGESGLVLFDTVRCLNARTMEQVWALEAGSAGQAGLVAVAGFRDGLYCVGQDSAGSFVIRVDAAGRRREAARLVPRERGMATGLLLLGQRPVVMLRLTDSDALHVFSPILQGPAEAPGYSGCRILKYWPLNLNRDTFPDLAVLRTSVDAGMRLDLFLNGMGALEAELAAVLAELKAAAGRRNDVYAAARAARRAQLLRAELDPAGVMTELELRARQRARRRETLTFIAGGTLTVLGAALMVLGAVGWTRLRRRRQRRLVEQAPLRVRAGLAVGLVGMDHNFVSKGNTAGAFERLQELRSRYGLEHDAGLQQLTVDYQPHYVALIDRLINHTPTLRLVEAIERAARSAVGPRPLTVGEISRYAYQGAIHREGFRIVLLRNREFPDALQRMRLLASPRLEAILEHVVVDHFRYARSFAEIVIDYTVNTHWNRKAFIQFISDSDRTVDFRHRTGHLVSELDELATLLPGVLDVPASDYEPAEPGEKLWLRITDLVAVLEDTLTRLNESGQEGR